MLLCASWQRMLRYHLTVVYKLHQLLLRPAMSLWGKHAKRLMLWLVMSLWGTHAEHPMPW